MKPLLVLTPLALEMSSLSEALTALGLRQNFELAVGGHGKVQFALTTQLLIQKHSPRLVVCAGAAGALSPQLKPLDVVIGEVTIEHDFRLRFVERPLPRFPADPLTFEKLKRRAQMAKFETHFGPLASGDEDILEPSRAAEIRKLTDALAVAWEGAGGARACRLHGVPFVEIRAVTDGADSAAPAEFAQNVRQGMAHIAEVLALL